MELTGKVKYFAKVSGIGISSFVKINLLAAVSTVTVLITAFILLSRGIDVGHSGHVSAIPFLMAMFLSRPVGSVLLLFIVISPYLFFMFGNKYIVSKISNRIIKDNSENYIYPMLDNVLAQLEKKQPDLFKKGADYTLLQMKLLQGVKEGTENKWLKRVIAFGIKKVKLDDVDFQNPNVSVADIIKNKVVNGLQNMTEPSRNNIWIILGLQWLSLLLIWLLPY